ncbi:HAD family hydrolase [Bdellovibrionota bacterium FG-2]
MALSSPKGILFDLDGTLIDSLSMTFDAFNHGVTRFGGPPLTHQEISSHFGPGEDKIFEKLVSMKKAQAAYQASIDYTNANLHRVPLHEGIAELLKNLKGTKIPLAIVTGRSWNTTEILLKHHDLLGTFKSVIANDHVPRPKPYPDGVKLASEHLKTSPEHTWFIGDSPVDMLAARSAGSIGIAALWDYTADREKLAIGEPNYWAKEPSEIVALLQSTSWEN